MKDGLCTLVHLVIGAVLVGEALDFAIVKIREAMRSFHDRPAVRLVIRKSQADPAIEEAESAWPNQGFGVWDRELDG